MKNLDIERIDDRYGYEKPIAKVEVQLPKDEREALDNILHTVLKADSERAVWGL